LTRTADEPLDLAPRPQVDAALAAAIYRSHFASATEATPTVVELPGERDRTFRIDLDGRPAFVLKVAGPVEDRDLLVAQNDAMRHLAARSTDLAVPTPVAARDGRTIVEASDASGVERLVRCLSWLPGTPLAFAATDRDDADLARSVGVAAGAVSRALADFHATPFARPFQWDVTRAWELVARHRGAVERPDRRALLDRWLIASAPVAAGVGALPRSVVHNDANDHNVLVEDGRVVGLIDFGDMVESVAIAEASVAVAYAMLDARDPLAVAAAVIDGFLSVRPVSTAEREAILPLAVARLALSAALSAYQQRRQPANPYLAISEAPVWEALERLDGVVFDAPRAPSDLLARRRRRLGPSLSFAYADPLTILLGRGAYLYDDHARRYLDGVNNVCHVGHAHPRVVAAGAGQMARLNTNTRYLHPLVVAYAERLTALLPAPLDVCYFVNSGSEANELALRLSRAATGRRDVAVLAGAYHGNTSSLVDISPYKFDGPGGAGRPDHVHVAPLPDAYRGVHPIGTTDLAAWYAERLTDVLAEATAQARPVGAFIVESLPGAAGQIVFPEGYLGRAYAAARSAGAIVIADEVQVGFGRVGSEVWGFELDAGAVPDIVTLGKPIGNGHPLGAVVTTRAIADAFANGMEYFSTFGGNPVSAAIGLAVLDVMRDEALQANALAIGTLLLERLRGLSASTSRIGDVRGAGLFIGVELVRDRDTRTPAATEATGVVESARAAGVLLSTDGPDHNVIKIKPPLVVGEREIERLLAALARGLAAIERA
jgi:4-aminobutyrate aminotransferase-like enzyme/Ser/Thr protein kinase RdoA (MazF antagonist)